MTEICIPAGTIVLRDDNALVTLAGDAYVNAERLPGGGWEYEADDSRFFCSGGLASVCGTVRHRDGLVTLS